MSLPTPPPEAHPPDIDALERAVQAAEAEIESAEVALEQARERWIAALRRLDSAKRDAGLLPIQRERARRATTGLPPAKEEP